MYNKAMVETVSNKPVTLGAMILKAQKNAAAAMQNPFSGALSVQQTEIADQVSLSENARSKLTAARKVNGFLSVFGSFLKSLNAPQYGIKPTKYGLEQSLGSTQKSTFQKDI